MTSPFALSSQFIDELVQLDPIFATGLGLPDKAHLWGDLGLDGETAKADLYRRYRDALAAHADHPDPQERRTVAVLTASLGERLDAFEHGDHLQDLSHMVGTFQQVVMEHLEPIAEETAPAPDEGLAELANAARQLAHLLAAAGEETRANILHGMRDADIFNRISDECYLRSLQCEIDRLACACEGGVDACEPRQEPSNEASRRFVDMLANIYSECFEAEPTPRENEPFHHILQAIKQWPKSPTGDQTLVKAAR